MPANLRSRTKSCFILLAASAGFALSACGDDAGGDGGSSTSGATDDTVGSVSADDAPTPTAPNTSGADGTTGSDDDTPTAATGDTGGTDTGDTDTGGTGSSDDGDSSEDGDSDEGSTGEPADCDNLVPLPIGYQTVSGPSSSEDFVLDADGYLVNLDNGNLVHATYGNASTLLFPGVGAGFASGTAMLSNGDVVFNASSQVTRVFGDGGTQVLASGLSYPNGLTVDMDDYVYVAENSGARVVRIDPQTLDVVVMADGLNSPNGLAFDYTYENLYVGSFGGGTVHRINIASGEVDLFASDIGTGGLDGVIVDACDNVYVTDFGPGIVYKVDGLDHELVVDLPTGWIPNMHFGSGAGGWDSQRLYVMDIGGDQQYELDLGVGGIPLPHL